MQKITYEYIKLIVETAGYTLLSNNKPLDNMIMVRCPAGHEYKVNYDCFIRRGTRCTMCSGRRKYTYGEAKSIIEKEMGYLLLSSEYSNSHNKLIVKCPKGHEYGVSLKCFIRGDRCGRCAGKCRYKFEEVKKIIEDQNYILLSESYINSSTKLKLKCPAGHEYNVTLTGFIRGSRCTACTGYCKLSFEMVKKNIESEGYTLISDHYVNSGSYLQMICPEGHEYTAVYESFQQGKRCKFCYLLNKESKGVQKIKHNLIQWNINYATEHRFPDCKNQKTLPFDFSILNEQNELLGLIEFHGQQHYYPNWQFDSKNPHKAFESQQFRDNIKLTYCRTTTFHF